MTRRLLLAAAVLGLAGCSSVTHELNVPPAMSPVGYGAAAEKGVGARTVRSRPVGKFSLWDDGQSRFFTDARAHQPGDVLTVYISISDRARFRNESERNRTATRNLTFGADLSWLGIGSAGSANGRVNSLTDSSGEAATERSEDIRLSVAAVVTGVLPNGNLLIQGSQEVLVNAELRVLTIDGIVRPTDISAGNTISYERIAEARISYGGRGRLTEVQQPPYGQQFLDRVLPF